MHKQMFITLDGGLVQSIDVSDDLEDVHVTLIDLDTDGADPGETVELPSGDEAFVDSPTVSKIGDGDVETWEAILKKEG